MSTKDLDRKLNQILIDYSDEIRMCLSFFDRHVFYFYLSFQLFKCLSEFLHLALSFFKQREKVIVVDVYLQQE